MKLTNEQIQQIDSYLASCGIKWYDVRVELTDHFANSIETKFDTITDFKQAIIDEHKSFGNNGFKELIAIKKKTVINNFNKRILKHLKSFFQIPRIIITVSVFWLLVVVMNLFVNKELFFELTSFLATIYVISLLIRVHKRKDIDEKFLAIDRNEYFLQISILLMVVFSNVNSFRSELSYTNDRHNYIHLAIFVLLVLFYWCGEYVYKKNKAEIKRLYSQAVI